MSSLMERINREVFSKLLLKRYQFKKYKKLSYFWAILMQPAPTFFSENLEKSDWYQIYGLFGYTTDDQKVHFFRKKIEFLDFLKD